MGGYCIMVNEERLNFIYSMYDSEGIDFLFKTLGDEVVTSLANEIQVVKPKYMEGGELDTDENAKKVVFAIVDEFADRLRMTVRERVALGEQMEKLKEMEEKKKVE